MRKFPGFFKVYYSSSATRLPIPSAFSSLIGAMPEMVVLKNSKGNLWPVKVTKEGSSLFFTDGWEAFVQENSVENMDILVFDYDGRNVMNVRLLDFASSTFEIKEEPKGDEDVEEAKHDVTVDEDEEEDDSFSHDTEDGDYMETEETDETDGDDDYEDEDHLGAETLGNAKKRGKMEQSSSKGFKSTNFKTSRDNKGKAFLKQEDECTIKEEVLEEKPAKRGGSKRKPDSRGKERTANNKAAIQEEDDIFKYEVVPWPKNPFFVGKIQEKRLNQLNIPLDVIKDHELNIPSSIDLIDEEGRKWSGVVRKWNDGRNVLIKGWKSFCKWNRVNPADRCICEFIQGKGRQGIFLKMRILRKGSWLPKH